MKIIIKNTIHAKIYYPQLIGKTFENCEEFDDFIKRPLVKNDGSQRMIIKSDCTILEKDSIISEMAPILKELKNIKNNISKLKKEEYTAINENMVEYILAIQTSTNKLKKKYNDMLRSHE